MKNKAIAICDNHIKKDKHLITLWEKMLKEEKENSDIYEHFIDLAKIELEEFEVIKKELTKIRKEVKNE